MDEPACTCRSLSCPHEGECGREAVLRVKIAIAVGAAGSFCPEFEVDLCEECWDRVKLTFSKSFRHGAGGDS